MFSSSPYRYSRSRFASVALALVVAVGLVGLASGCQNEPPSDPRFDDPSVRRPNNSRKLSVVFVDGVAVPVESAEALAKMRNQRGAMPGAMPRAMLGEVPGEMAGAMPSPGPFPNAKWKVPNAWRSVKPSSRLRLAEYEVPPASEGSIGANVAVFYFGGSDAAMADETLRLWASSFDDAAVKRAKRWTRQNGNTAKGIEVSGAFRPATKLGGNDTEGAAKSDWTLIGAVVQTQQGPYFLKLLGPADAVGQAQKDFWEVVDSLTLEVPLAATSASAVGPTGSHPASAASTR